MFQNFLQKQLKLPRTSIRKTNFHPIRNRLTGCSCGAWASWASPWWRRAWLEVETSTFLTSETSYQKIDKNEKKDECADETREVIETTAKSFFASTSWNPRIFLSKIRFLGKFSESRNDHLLKFFHTTQNVKFARELFLFVFYFRTWLAALGWNSGACSLKMVGICAPSGQANRHTIKRSTNSLFRHFEALKLLKLPKLATINKNYD